MSSRILRLNFSPLWLPKQWEEFLVVATMPRFHRFRKFQRGSVGSRVQAAAAQQGTSGIVPSITDIVLDFTDATGPNNVGLIFNDVAQGVGAINTMVKRHKTTYTEMGDDDTPTDHTGEWTPSASGVVGSEWEVACTSLTMGTWSTEPAAVGVFTDLSTSDILWNVNRVGGKGRVTGTTQVIGDMEFREVADTANNTTFELNVTNTQI